MKSIRFILPIICIVLSCGTVNNSHRPAKSTTTKTTAPSTNTVSTLADEILTSTNKERNQRRLGTLGKDDRLMKAAQDYAVMMSKADKLSHTVNGQQLATRAALVKYPWKSLAENVAENSALKSDEVVTQQWMKSTGHKANILGKDFTHIGIGIAGPSKSGRYYYCQIFGSTK